MSPNLIVHAITIKNPKRNDTVQLRIHQDGSVSVKFINHTKTQLFKKSDTASFVDFLKEYFYPRELIRIMALLTKERNRHPIITELLHNLSKIGEELQNEKNHA